MTSGICTNPEQLFAAGWSACFEGAIGRIIAPHDARWFEQSRGSPMARTGGRIATTQSLAPD